MLVLCLNSFFFFFFLVCECPFIVALFVKGYLCFIVLPLLPCQWSVDYIYVGLFLNLFFCSVIYMPIPSMISHFSESSDFVLLQYHLGYSGYFVSPYKLENQFVNVYKLTYLFFFIVISLNQVGYKWHLDNSESSYLWIWSIYLIILVFFFSSEYCSFPHIDLFIFS